MCTVIARVADNVVECRAQLQIRKSPKAETIIKQEIAVLKAMIASAPRAVSNMHNRLQFSPVYTDQFASSDDARISFGPLFSLTDGEFPVAASEFPILPR